MVRLAHHERNLPFNRCAPFKPLQMKAGSKEGDSAGRFHVSAIPETAK